MKTKRFSKQLVIDAIDDRMRHLKEEFLIDQSNGYAQCKGKSEAFVRAYGEFCGLERLAAVLYLT